MEVAHYSERSEQTHYTTWCKNQKAIIKQQNIFCDSTEPFFELHKKKTINRRHEVGSEVKRIVSSMFPWRRVLKRLIIVPP